MVDKSAQSIQLPQDQISMKGLDKMLEKYFPTQHRLYDTIKRLGNQLRIPNPPESYDENGDYYYQEWKMRSKQPHFYQGEINQYGERDGRGVYLNPGSCIGFGYQKNDKLHGPFLWLFSDGGIVQGTWTNGQTDGRLTTVSPDGKKVKNEIWKNGKFIGKEAPATPDKKLKDVSPSPKKKKTNKAKV